VRTALNHNGRRRRTWSVVPAPRWRTTGADRYQDPPPFGSVPPGIGAVEVPQGRAALSHAPATTDGGRHSAGKALGCVSTRPDGLQPE
jgi:hypothetical protein